MPQITSGSAGNVYYGQNMIYQADADDSNDVSNGIVYSLEGGAGDLTIDPVSGAVRLLNGVANTSSYNFNLVVTDTAGNEARENITVSALPAIDVSGPGALVEGALVPSLHQLVTGETALTVGLNPALLDEFSQGIENFDFVLTYSVKELGEISSAQIALTQGAIGLPNSDVAGVIEIGAFSFPGTMSEEDPLVSISLGDSLDLSSVSVQIRDISIGLRNDFDNSSYTLSLSPVSLVEGTDQSESFILTGGQSEVSGGLGSDVFMITESVNSLTAITDFTSGEDTIDVSLLAAQFGYSGYSDIASDDVLVRYSGDEVNVGELVSSSDETLDNVFGSFFDSGVLSLFIDGSSVSGEVAVEMFQVTLPDDYDLNNSDITATTYSFIA